MATRNLLDGHDDDGADEADNDDNDVDSDEDGKEDDHCDVGDKSTFVSLLSMLLEALVGCKLPSCSSSIGAAAKISSCQVVQEADRIICGDCCDLFTFNSVHHIGRLHSPS